MEKLFARGKLEDVKHRWFLLCLCHDIKKLSIMRDYVNMEALLVVALEVKQVLVELGEIPFELLKEEQEENMIIVLNESLINLLKRQLNIQFRLEALAKGSTSSNGCKICHEKDHMGNDCPRYATFRPKC